MSPGDGPIKIDDPNEREVPGEEYAPQQTTALVRRPIAGGEAGYEPPLMTEWKRMLGLFTIAVGVLAGVGLVTFDYAAGFSYLSTDPKACVNCHIMQSQYDSWQKASHHTAAACVDCHLPTEFFHKYLTKAEHGWNHSKGFTLMDFHEPIRLTASSAGTLEANCVRCHADLVHAQSGGRAEAAPNCRHCHADVGHGPRAGLGGPLHPHELGARNP